MNPTIIATSNAYKPSHPQNASASLLGFLVMSFDDSLQYIPSEEELETIWRFLFGAFMSERQAKRLAHLGHHPQAASPKRAPLITPVASRVILLGDINVRPNLPQDNPRRASNTPRMHPKPHRRRLLYQYHPGPCSASTVERHIRGR